MKRQAGATLMETMIALALSVIVTTAMVVLMGNSMGTSNRITQMTQLTDELRNVMSMMTRDLRRANYSSTALFCYGNPSCSEHPYTRQYADGDVPGTGDLELVEDPVDGCVIFQLDRLANLDGDATNDSKGGFRRVVNDDGVGIVEMWVGADNGDVSRPACDDPGNLPDDGWLTVSDPNIVDIVGLTVNATQDADGIQLSAEKSILQDSGTTSYTQRQRQLVLGVEGELILEQRMGWTRDANPIMVRRRVDDVILVRNDYIYPPVPTS